MSILNKDEQKLDEIHQLEDRYTTLIAMYADCCEALEILLNKMGHTKKELIIIEEKLKEVGYTEIKRENDSK